MRPRLGRQPGNSGNTIRQVLEMTINFLTSIVDGDRGGGRPGEEGAGSGITKVAGSGRKREKCALFRNISQSKKCKE